MDSCARSWETILRKLNRPYYYCMLVSLRYEPMRKNIMMQSRKIAEKMKRPLLFVLCSILRCCNKNVITFKKSYKFEFYKKTRSDHDTYLPTFFNYRIIYLDKMLFNRVFSAFINCGWLDVRHARDKELMEFTQKVLLKVRDGNSGAGIEVRRISNLMEFAQYIRASAYDLAEQRIYNHLEIARFSPTLSNTVCVVMIGIGAQLYIIYAGLRVDQKASTVDNVSQGGRVFRLNLETKKAATEFCRGKTRINKSFHLLDDIIGFQVPCWYTVLDTLRRASMAFQEMQFVGWNVAVIETGACLIKANHSVGSEIMQAHLKNDEEGLRPILNRHMENIFIRTKNQTDRCAKE